MPDRLFSTFDLFIAATFVFLVLALVVWTRIGPKRNSGEPETGSDHQRTASLVTQVGHWAGAAVRFVIGVLLGVAVNGLAQLVGSGAWVAVFNLLVLAGVLVLIVRAHERLGDMLFPSGIRPARNTKKARNPLIRRFAMPAGLVVGVGMAALGLDGWLLGWFS
jgi:hypothetical protein